MAIGFDRSYDDPPPPHRAMRSLVMLCAVCSLWATAVSAECLFFGPKVMLDDRFSFILDGTVLAMNDSGPRPVATIEVHRVFKGQLPARIEVLHFRGFEYPDLEVGKRYVLAIDRFADEVTHGPPDNRTWYETIKCVAALREVLIRDGVLDGFGRGWPPTR